MLLVDVRQRRIESVRREQLLRPFVPLSGLRTIDDAGQFLCRFRHGDASLRHALVRETTRGTLATSLGTMTDSDLIAATAREIAAWRMQVGSLLPEPPALIFDGQAPWGGSFACRLSELSGGIDVCEVVADREPRNRGHGQRDRP
jgi:hypothetical protein